MHMPSLTCKEEALIIVLVENILEDHDDVEARKGDVSLSLFLSIKCVIQITAMVSHASCEQYIRALSYCSK